MKPVQPPMPDLSTPVSHKNPNSPIEVSLLLFTVIIGLILLVVGAIVGYTFYVQNQTPRTSPQLISPTPQPKVVDATLNWKTYRNDKYGFGFKYPQSMIVSEDKNKMIVKVQSPNQSEYLFSIQIFQNNNVNNYTLEKFIEISLGYPTKTTFNPTVISGLEALKTKEVPGYEGKEVVFVVKGLNIYAIINNSINNLEYNFDQILSTFKFLDDEMANWKTYNNAEFGFILKYPANWSLKDTVNKKTINFYNEYSTEALVFELSSEEMKTIDGIKSFECSDNPSVIDCENLSNEDTTIIIDWVAIDGRSSIGPPIVKFSSRANNIYVSVKGTFDDDQNFRQKNILRQILSTFRFIDQNPSPTCIPRPACLDTEPRCLIPETVDMCPSKTPVY